MEAVALRKLSRRLLTPALVLSLPWTVSCVSQKRFEASQNAAQQEAAARELAQSACTQTITGLQNEKQACEGKLSEYKAENAMLADRLRAEGITVEALAAEREDAQRAVEHTSAQLEASRAKQGELERALASYRERERAAQARMEQYRSLLARFKPLVDSGQLSVRIVDGKMVLTLPMDILFSSGSSRVSRDGRSALAEVAKVLADEKDRTRRYQVEGHTDNVPIRTSRFPSNWELSSARALSVVSELMKSGLAPEQLSSAGYAQYQPRATNETDEGKALNRRIEIVVLPDLSGLPGYEELSKIAGAGG